MGMRVNLYKLNFISSIFFFLNQIKQFFILPTKHIRENKIFFLSPTFPSPQPNRT